MSMIEELIASKTPQEWGEIILQYSSKNALAVAFGFKSNSTQAYRFANALYEMLPDFFDEYTGQGWNKGNFNMERFKDGTIFVTDMREPLIAERGHVCECCGNSEWLGKPIPLEVHHKNGNSMNNEKSNLELLCPNCHAFTDTHRGKKGKNRRYASDEEIVEIIKVSRSVNDVLIKLNMAVSGYSYERVRNIMRIYNLSFEK